MKTEIDWFRTPSTDDKRNIASEHKRFRSPRCTHLNGDVAGTAVYSDGIFPERHALFSHQDARLHGSAHRNDFIWGDGVQQLHVWEQISDHLLQLGNASRASAQDNLRHDLN